MKLFCYNFLITFLVFSLSACNQQSGIRKCFETRLEIKNMMKASDDLEKLVKSEEYIALKVKKKECLSNIEPEYFEERELYRNGRDDKYFPFIPTYHLI